MSRERERAQGPGLSEGPSPGSLTFVTLSIHRPCWNDHLHRKHSLLTAHIYGSNIQLQSQHLSVVLVPRLPERQVRQ